MTLGRFLVGLALTGLTVTSAAMLAVCLRRLFFADAEGVCARIVEGTFGTGILVLGGVVLGTVGLLRPVPLCLAAAPLLILARRIRPTVEPSPASSTPQAKHAEPRLAMVATWIVAAVVAVRWVAELLQTLATGLSHPDDLHYHLTHAARFAQSGQTWPISFDSVGDGSAFHPSNSELLHATFMTLLGSDTLSLIVNLPFAALAIGAGWQLGRRAGNASAGAIIMSAVLALRLVTEEGGSALNDVMAMSLLLTGCALLIEAHGRRAALRYTGLAGLAVGLAAGTKLTVLVPAAALCLLAMLVGGRQRARALACFVAGAALGGGYWYARNLINTGNPVPALSFGPLPGPDLAAQRAVEFPILEYLTDGTVWRVYFIPGLRTFFGPAWPILPGLAFFGAAAVVASPRLRRQERHWVIVAVVGLLALAAYVATPTSAAGHPGAPTLFGANLRYALPSLLLCALAALAHPAVRRRSALATVTALVAFTVSNAYGGDATRTAAAAVVVLAGIAAGVALHRAPRPALSAAAVLLLPACALVGAVAQDRYLDHRWTDERPRWSAYDAVREVRGSRIAITGYPQNYPFFGADLSNEVTTLGDRSAGDELLPLRTCEAWWRAVADVNPDLVVVLSQPALAASDLGRYTIDLPLQWLEDAGARALLSDEDSTIFAMAGVQPACTS